MLTAEVVQPVGALLCELLSNTLVYVKLAVIHVNEQCILSMYGIQWRPRWEGSDLVPTMPSCVCPKVKDMGPFSALRE